MKFYESLKILLVCVLPVIAGCSKPSLPDITYRDLLESMLDTERICDLSQPGSILFSSWDRSGGNDDCGNFLGDGPTGWKILCDVKGSGYISRSWFTGSKDSTKRIRFYVDNAKTPIHETTLADWCGIPGRFENLPIHGYEPYCWFSWVPISFNRRLIVMEEAPVSDEKIYYQINVNLLSDSKKVESWHPDMLKEHDVQETIKRINEKWTRLQHVPVPNDFRKFVAEPGIELVLFQADGHGIIRDLSFSPLTEIAEKVEDREELLRALIVRAYWDGVEEPSVEVPLGVLCGSMWHEISYSSIYFGVSSGIFRIAFPMPFRDGAKIAILNQSPAPVELGFSIDIDEQEPNETSGYFHTGWRKSLATQVGVPHTVLNTKGRGKFVGCLLGVINLDSSWWALEGDEQIIADGGQTSKWLGTGLEDYFNGGWYYGNALASPLHGIPFKAPFRTLQYRIHLTDPVNFNSDLNMTFERGPDHESHAEMESVSFYYLEFPGKADSDLRDLEFRRPVEDPVRPYTLMTEVNNMERLGDISGAIRTINDFIERYPDLPLKDVLERRIANYSNPPVIETGRAIIGVYANTLVRIFLDGKLLFSVNDPKAMRVNFQDIELPPGDHILAIQYGRHAYPDWVQLMLEYPGGFIGTDNSWKFAFDPVGKWADYDYDDMSWSFHEYIWRKGPPEAPYVWCEPHDRVMLQSKAWAIAPAVDWPMTGKNAVFRKKFSVPETEK
ncbi:MAG: DUF2961 domain-containing protein [Lentisphaerae bacterium]|nr:DUF2961 domain-containing protein [Lentisphaerota bacterium]